MSKRNCKEIKTKSKNTVRNFSFQKLFTSFRNMTLGLEHIAVLLRANVDRFPLRLNVVALVLVVGNDFVLGVANARRVDMERVFRAAFSFFFFSSGSSVCFLFVFFIITVLLILQLHFAGTARKC